MHSDDDDEEGDEREVDDGVDEDGDGAGLQVAELHQVVAAGELDEQPRREQHEQHQPNHHGAPVRHLARSTMNCLPTYWSFWLVRGVAGDRRKTKAGQASRVEKEVCLFGLPVLALGSSYISLHALHICSASPAGSGWLVMSRFPWSFPT